MAKFKDARLEQNEQMTEMPAFMDSYNSMIPKSSEFPRASIKLLKQFQSSHPLFFKNGEAWSLVKHRKKFMDWLTANFSQPKAKE